MTSPKIKKSEPLTAYRYGKKFYTQQTLKYFNQCGKVLWSGYSLDKLIATENSQLKSNPLEGLCRYGPWVLDAMLENNKPSDDFLTELGTFIQPVLMAPLIEDRKQSIDWTRFVTNLDLAITRYIKSETIPKHAKSFVAILDGDLYYIKGVSSWNDTQEMCTQYESLVKDGNPERAFSLAKSIVEHGNYPIHQLNRAIKMYELAQDSRSIEKATRFRDEMKKLYRSTLETVSKGPGSIWLA